MIAFYVSFICCCGFVLKTMNIEGVAGWTYFEAEPRARSLIVKAICHFDLSSCVKCSYQLVLKGQEWKNLYYFGLFQLPPWRLGDLHDKDAGQECKDGKGLVTEIYYGWTGGYPYMKVNLTIPANLYLISKIMTSLCSLLCMGWSPNCQRRRRWFLSLSTIMTLLVFTDNNNNS